MVLKFYQDDLKNQKKIRALSLTPVATTTKFHPCLSYLHLVVKKTKVNALFKYFLTKKENDAKQTFPYVKYVFDLLLEHGLFDHHSNIKLWSDGRGKHFKAYSTQAFMCHFKERLQQRQDSSWVNYFCFFKI